MSVTGGENKHDIAEFLKDFTFISAADYISAHPGAGSCHMSRPFGIPWYAIDNCLCSGRNGQVVIPLRADGRQFVLRESFNYDHDETLLAALLSSAVTHTEDAEILDEAVPLYPLWSLGNVWHWFFDSAPKVLVMEAAGYAGPYIINTQNAVMREGMGLLGVGAERLVHCASPHLLRRALLPGVLGIPEIDDRKKIFLALRERVFEHSGVLEGDKRCFIRRIGERRLANEEEFAGLMARYDIEVLVPEEYSLAEQARFMSNAGLTLSPHGANSVLALFQKPRSVFMEFFGHDHINNICNLGIIKTLKLLYIPVTESVFSREVRCPDSFRHTGDGKLRDMYINTALVEAILDNIHTVTYSF